MNILSVMLIKTRPVEKSTDPSVACSCILVSSYDSKPHKANEDILPLCLDPTAPPRQWLWEWSLQTGSEKFIIRSQERNTYEYVYAREKTIWKFRNVSQISIPISLGPFRAFTWGHQWLQKTPFQWLLKPPLVWRASAPSKEALFTISAGLMGYVSSLLTQPCGVHHNFPFLFYHNWWLGWRGCMLDTFHLRF